MQQQQPRVPDNVDGSCIGRMAYAQYWTDWRPRCQQAAGPTPAQPMSSYDYRMYLTKNAERMMAAWRSDAAVGCCGGNAGPVSVPARQVQVCDGQTCTLQAGDYCGVGTDRAAKR